MASIRKRGSSYLLVVSMGYDYKGNRIKPKQRTVHSPEGLTPKQREKWLNEQAVLFERECKGLPQEVDRSITLAKYTELWFQTIAPGKLAKSTLARERQDIDRFLPVLGNLKLTELRSEHFRQLYANLRKVKNQKTGKPLSECTVEGVHACLCGILSDAMEGGFLDHNPAWRTYRYAGKKKEKLIADKATAQRLIAALEEESLKYEAYFKLIIATGMRRGECCGLKWDNVDFKENTITIKWNLCYTPAKGVYLDTPKNGKTRTIDVDPDIISLLRTLREDQSRHAISPFVFTQDNSPEPMHPQSPTRYLKKFAQRYKVPDLHPHKLRHTFASIAITNGADVASISEKLGHSDKAVTLRMYTHADQESMKRASQIFRDALKNDMKKAGQG